MYVIVIRAIGNPAVALPHEAELSVIHSSGSIRVVEPSPNYHAKLNRKPLPNLGIGDFFISISRGKLLLSWSDHPYGLSRTSARVMSDIDYFFECVLTHFEMNLFTQVGTWGLSVVRVVDIPTESTFRVSKYLVRWCLQPDNRSLRSAEIGHGLLQRLLVFCHQIGQRPFHVIGSINDFVGLLTSTTHLMPLQQGRSGYNHRENRYGLIRPLCISPPSTKVWKWIQFVSRTFAFALGSLLLLDSMRQVEVEVGWGLIWIPISLILLITISGWMIYQTSLFLGRPDEIHDRNSVCDGMKMFAGF
jgi:hypothetical protein